MAHWLLARQKEIFISLVIFALILVSYFGYPYIADTQHLPLLPAYHDALSFRDILRAANPLDDIPHSKTLGVASRLYVIGLPEREDRRIIMGQLADALDITLTWHNATNLNSSIISVILDRLEDRHSIRQPFAWADDVESDEVLQPGNVSGSELWFLPPSSPLALPPLELGPDYVRNNDTHWMAEIACWYSHSQLLRRIAEGDDDVAFIFEDDVDMEWDMERRLHYLWKFLPNPWDMVFLGHCYSDEYKKGAVEGTMYLYKSNDPLCLHAYAVTKKSATRMVRLLRSPLYAYSKPLDHATRQFIGEERVHSFSVLPPIATQHRTTRSSIVGGNGPWTYPLADGALKRIQIWEESKNS